MPLGGLGENTTRKCRKYRRLPVAAVGISAHVLPDGQVRAEQPLAFGAAKADCCQI
jgi:hypothetical protein